MTVRYEEEIYEHLKGQYQTCVQISYATKIPYNRVWNALTQLEQKKLVIEIDTCWRRVDEHP